MFLALKKNASLNNFQMQLIKFVNKIAGRNIVIRKNKFKGKLEKTTEDMAILLLGEIGYLILQFLQLIKNIT